MKTKILFSAVLLISIFISCKKEGPEGPTGPPGSNGSNGIGSADPNIYNKWEVISGMPGTKYLIIKNNNSYYQLDSAAYGFKGLYRDFAFITGAQILCWDAYNYTISNDTLTLNNLYGTVLLKKNSAAPDETQWVTYVTVTDSINNPVVNGDGRQDLGFDGTDILWTADSNSDTVYKINPSTHAISRLALSQNYYYGQLNYAASAIWLSNGYVIDKINPANGTVISTSPSLASNYTLDGIALVGQNMWYCDWQNNISTWDVVSNSITPQLQHRITGMEYVNGYLYMRDGPNLYKCQTAPSFAVLATYYINSPNAEYNGGGITYDGSHFWIVGYDYATNAYKLMRLTI